MARVDADVSVGVTAPVVRPVDIVVPVEDPVTPVEAPVPDVDELAVPEPPVEMADARSLTVPRVVEPPAEELDDVVLPLEVVAEVVAVFDAPEPEVVVDDAPVLPIVMPDVVDAAVDVLLAEVPAAAALICAVAA